MKRFLAAIVALGLVAPGGAARADHQTGFRWFVDLAPTIGATHVSGGGTAASIGWHPELVLAATHQDYDGNNVGAGLGFYGSLTSAYLKPQAGWASAGVEVVGYLPKLRSIALSFGAAEGNHHGEVLEVGGFLGWRLALGHFDMPVGLRTDVRPGTSTVPTSFTVALQVDVVPLSIVLYYLFHGMMHTD